MPVATLLRRYIASPLFFCLFSAFLLPLSAVSAAATPPLVLFDQGHGQHFVIEKEGALDLSKLADLIRQQGAVVSGSKEKLTRGLLAGKKGLIISGPFVRYSNGEIDDLINFVMEGGRLAVMLHIPMPVYSLLHRLDVDASPRIILEHNGVIDNNSKYFRVGVFLPHKLTSGLQQFSIYGTWALLNTRPNVEVIAKTSPGAWMDLNMNGKLDKPEPAGTFAVVVAGRLGKGEYLVFGDDAIFQNRFLDGDNKKLAENLIAWLLQ